MFSVVWRLTEDIRCLGHCYGKSTWGSYEKRKSDVCFDEHGAALGGNQALHISDQPCVTLKF